MSVSVFTHIASRVPSIVFPGSLSSQFGKIVGTLEKSCPLKADTLCGLVVSIFRKGDEPQVIRFPPQSHHSLLGVSWGPLLIELGKFRCIRGDDSLFIVHRKVSQEMGLEDRLPEFQPLF